jgi:hypothetical protein
MGGKSKGALGGIKLGGDWGKGIGNAFEGAGKGFGGVLKTGSGVFSGAFGGLLGDASSTFSTPLIIGGVLIAGVTIYAINRGSSVATTALDNPESLRILAQAAAAGPEMAAASALSGALR